MLKWIVWNRIICIIMDLALNNQQRVDMLYNLTNQPTHTHTHTHKYGQTSYEERWEPIKIDWSSDCAVLDKKDSTFMISQICRKRPFYLVTSMIFVVENKQILRVMKIWSNKAKKKRSIFPYIFLEHLCSGVVCLTLCQFNSKVL